MKNGRPGTAIKGRHKTAVFRLPEPPWDRYERESLPAYAAFLVYLYAGANRTIKAAAGKLKKHPQTLAVWSSQWRWVDRVAAYETSLEQKKLQTREELILAGYEKLAQHIPTLIEKLIQLSEDGDKEANVQLGAVRDALDRAGVIAPKELVIKGDPEKPIKHVIEVPQKQIDATTWEKQYAGLPPGVKEAVVEGVEEDDSDRKD